MKLPTTVILEIDLLSIPWADWPENAKRLGYSVLLRHHKQFFAELPELRKSLLVAKVEKLLEGEADLFSL